MGKNDVGYRDDARCNERNDNEGSDVGCIQDNAYIYPAFDTVEVCQSDHSYGTIGAGKISHPTLQ